MSGRAERVYSCSSNGRCSGRPSRSLVWHRISFCRSAGQWAQLFRFSSSVGGWLTAAAGSNQTLPLGLEQCPQMALFPRIAFRCPCRSCLLQSRQCGPRRSTPAQRYEVVAYRSVLVAVAVLAIHFVDSTLAARRLKGSFYAYWISLDRRCSRRCCWWYLAAFSSTPESSQTVGFSLKRFGQIFQLYGPISLGG
jgi:hypothetical protein